MDYHDPRSIVNNPCIIQYNEKKIIDDGSCDGLAYQIGIQPLARTYAQFGYVYPMKTKDDIQQLGIFERLRFRHTVELSQRIYKLMDGGKKIYPDEGIQYVSEQIDCIKKNMIFSEDDLDQAYIEADKTIFSSFSDFYNEIKSSATKNFLKEVYGNSEELIIQKEEKDYSITQEIVDKVNEWYNNNNEYDVCRGFYSVDRTKV